MSFRHRIGSDPSCTDSRYWKFERTSGLPIDYFEKRRSWESAGDKLVIVLAMIVLVAFVCGWF